MLKKNASLLLSFALLFFLCACAAQGEEEAGGSFYDDLMGELQPSDSPEPEEKRVLCLSFYGENAISAQMYNHAVAYMAEHPDVYIELEPQGYDYNTELSVRLMSGTGPDVIHIVPGAVNLNDEHFLDLYPFMKNDSDFQEDDYYMNVLAGAETDGKLYRIGASYMLYGLYAMRKDLDPEAAKWFETAETVTYADMVRLYQQVGLPEGLIIYEGFLPIDAFMYYDDSSIDLEKGTCNYSSEEFKSLLEQMIDLPADPGISYTQDQISQVPGEPKTTVDISDYSNTQYPYFFYDPFIMSRPDFLFPYEGKVFTQPRIVKTASGKGMYMIGDFLAITDTCKDPDLAWDFIKFCIANKEKPYQELEGYARGNQLTLGGVPSVNRYNYARQCEINVTFQYEQIEETSGDIPMGEKEQVIADALDFLTTLPDQLELDRSVYNIDIWPEQYLWLTGKQSLDVMLENIQSKVTLYLNE